MPKRWQRRSPTPARPAAPAIRSSRRRPTRVFPEPPSIQSDGSSIALLFVGRMDRSGCRGPLPGTGQRLLNDLLGLEAPRSARRCIGDRRSRSRMVIQLLSIKSEIEQVENEIARLGDRAGPVLAANQTAIRSRRSLRRWAMPWPTAGATRRYLLGKLPDRATTARKAGHGRTPEKAMRLLKRCFTIHPRSGSTARLTADRTPGSVEVGKAGEVLEERPARKSSDGRDGAGGWFRRRRPG